MRKKIIVITFGLILSAVLLFGAMPVAAAGSASTTPPATTQTAGKGQLLRRILSIQDQAKLEALLAKAEANGKITADQAAKIEAFWTAHHAQFARARILQRILGIKNETTLDALLAKAQSAGKITADQAAKIKTLWETVHNG